MLTGRQQEIWDFLVDYVGRHGYPPTVREIGERVGLASPSTVHAHLANLERAGLSQARPDEAARARAHGARAARRGRGRASADTGAAARRRDRRRRAAARRGERRGVRRACPSALVGGAADFLLRVKGDSMIDAGILDGDLVVVRAPDDARRTATSSSRSPATTRPPTRRPSSASSARTAASGCSPRTRRSSRSTRGTSRSSARWWGCSGRCDRRRP